MYTKKSALLLIALLSMLTLFSCGSTEADAEAGADVEVKAGEKAEAEAEAKFEEVVIVDNEQIVFKITGIDPDNMWGYTLKAHIENKTDKNLMFSWDNTSVNGFMCDPFWATDVQAGKKAVTEISFISTDFEDLGITDVTDIEFTLRVNDEDDWEADPIHEEVYELVFEE